MEIVDKGQLEMLAVIFAAGITASAMPIFFIYSWRIVSEIKGFAWVVKEIFTTMYRNLTG